MRVKTVVLERLGRRRVVERNLFILTVTHTFNIIFGAVLPFIIGFYFARTENFMFFLFFALALFFEIRLEYKGETIKLKVMRLF